VLPPIMLVDVPLLPLIMLVDMSVLPHVRLFELLWEIEHKLGPG
jgi:hypothetical protein